MGEKQPRGPIDGSIGPLGATATGRPDEARLLAARAVVLVVVDRAARAILLAVDTALFAGSELATVVGSVGRDVLVDPMLPTLQVTGLARR